MNSSDRLGTSGVPRATVTTGTNNSTKTEQKLHLTVAAKQKKM